MKVPELLTLGKVKLGLDSESLKAELIERINAHYEALRKNRINNNKKDNNEYDSEKDSSV
jgi:hypothetical protein